MRGVWIGVAMLGIGCVGGDSSNGKSPGTLGGPCFANNTCNTGLSCVLENGAGVCEGADGSVLDAPADQSTSDVTTTDSASDAPADVNDAGCSQSLAPSTACPNQSCDNPDAGTTACCPKTGQCVDAINNCSNGQIPIWSCQSRADCVNQFCCVAVNNLSFDTCPPSGQFDTSLTDQNATAACSASCSSAQVALCANSGDCPQQTTCVGVAVGLGQPLGICH